MDEPTDLDEDYSDDFEEESSDTCDKYQCNLCLDTYEFEDYGKCPYKLCPNDHYYHGSCIEEYIKNQIHEHVHTIRYYPNDMCLTIQSRPIHELDTLSFTITCPDCRRGVKFNGYTRLERSRIYEQLIKGNIDDESTLGKKIGIIRKVNKQLKDGIKEMHDAKTIYDDMLEKYTLINKEYDKELIMTQENLNEMTIKIKENKESIIDLEDRKLYYIEKYKQEALDTISEELTSKKQIMCEEVNKFKDLCDKEITRYQKLKEEEFDTYIDLHRRIYLQKSKLCEEEYARKELELIKEEERVAKELNELYLDLDTNKDDAVWKYIETHDLIDRFIELARDTDRENLNKERDIKIKAMNDAVDKRREELMVNLRKEIDIKRKYEINKINTELNNLLQKKR